MPTSYIKRISNDHNISINQLEKDWEEAKTNIDKDSNGYWPKVVSVFKNIINSKYNINENISFKDFQNLTNENYEEQEEIPTKSIQQQNVKDKYEDAN